VKRTILTGLLLLGALFATGCSPARDLAELTVLVQGQGVVEPERTDNFVKGSAAELRALPAAGWQFSRWEGAVAEPFSPQTTIFMNGRRAVTAIFIPRQEVEIIKPPGGMITWRADGSQVNKRPGAQQISNT